MITEFRKILINVLNSIPELTGKVRYMQVYDLNAMPYLTFSEIQTNNTLTTRIMQFESTTIQFNYFCAKMEMDVENVEKEIRSKLDNGEYLFNGMEDYYLNRIEFLNSKTLRFMNSVTQLIIQYRFNFQKK